MIEEKPDGRVIIHFGDWTPLMISLSTRLHRLPLRPDDADTMAFEVGIDRLHSMGSRGDRAMELLIENIDALEYRPNHAEVVALGEALIQVEAELHTLRRMRADDRMRQMFRKRLQERLRRPTPKYGFVRGPKSLPDEDYPPDGHIFAAKACLDAGKKLSAWEVGFLKGMQEDRSPSPKQKRLLGKICEKCQVRWA